jgi:hypothetical protein
VVLQAACDRGAAGCVGAFERTKCDRTHYGRIFTLSPLSCPLLAMFVATTCTTHNTKNYTKILVINAAKSLTNISKGGSNNQYLTPITGRGNSHSCYTSSQASLVAMSQMIERALEGEREPHKAQMAREREEITTQVTAQVTAQVAQ